MNKIEQLIKDIPQKYLLVIFSHILLGILIFEFTWLSKLYGFLILCIGGLAIVKDKNKNNEVLFASAYVVGAEVFLRMTHGNPNYEFGKYAIVLFAALGIYYSGFFKRATPYWIFILLLLPSVFVSVWKFHIPIHKKILFDLSGPLALAIFSMYTYRRPIALKQVNEILLAIGLPIVSCCTYVFLYHPNSHNAYLNMQSSFLMSGNFGPNQVATILGLGILIFFTRLILKSDSMLHFIINLSIMVFVALRGLLTFSRGGMITAGVMVFFFLFYMFWHLKNYDIFQLKLKLAAAILSLAGVFLLANYESDGLLVNRYTNKNLKGGVKKDSPFQRERLLTREVNMFIENPVLGIGVGKGKQDSIAQLGKKISTHNELTRMLSEHGLFGIAGLLILMIVPFVLLLKTRQNFYFLSFYLFWLLTITHTGMRIAAPSFLYALSLLQIQSKKE